MIDKYISELSKSEEFFITTERRKNLLVPFDIPKGKTILEINAGVGVMTGLLCENNSVTCVEEKKEYADILKGKFSNVIVKTTLADVSDRDLFDYIYIWGYDNSKHNVQTLVSKLETKGKLFVSADNRIAFKELLGYKKIKGTVLFEGIYNESKALCSLNEWKDALNQIENVSYDFYYPYPDWRTPVYIFSDEKLPQSGELNINGLNLFEYRVNLFNDDKVMDTFSREGLFPHFTNSFLIIISKE